MNPEEPIEEIPNNWDKQPPHNSDGVGSAGTRHPVHHGVGTGNGSNVGDDSGASVGDNNDPRK